MSLKEIFLSEVRRRMYKRLRSDKLKGWDVGDALNFASAIVTDNAGLINDYLSKKEVTLQNLDESLEELVDKILNSIRIK